MQSNIENLNTENLVDQNEIKDEIEPEILEKLQENNIVILIDDTNSKNQNEPEEQKKQNEDSSDEDEYKGLNDQEKNEKKRIQGLISNILKEHYLSNLQTAAALKFINDKVFNPNDETVERLRQWFLMKINGKRMPDVYHPRQLGCPDLVPGLPLKGWWEREEVPWVLKLEEQFHVIKEELLNLRSQKGFQPYRSPGYARKIRAEDNIGSLGTDTGSWNVFYLYLHDIPFDDNLAKIPKTIQILNELVPRNYKHCFFSAVTPGTHITHHNGPTGKKLRIHLPILGTEGARMRVGDEVRYLEEGKCIIFDDSFNHEAWYNGNQTRINLIVDIWHPNLTDPEVKFFQMLLKSKLKAEKFLCEKYDNQDQLFSIIQKTKDMIKSNDSWWLS